MCDWGAKKGLPLDSYIVQFCHSFRISPDVFTLPKAVLLDIEVNNRYR